MPDSGAGKRHAWSPGAVLKMGEDLYGDADTRSELLSLARGVRTLLEEMRESGLDELPLPQIVLSEKPSTVLTTAAPEIVSGSGIFPEISPKQAAAPETSVPEMSAMKAAVPEAPVSSASGEVPMKGTPPAKEHAPHAELFELTRGVRALLEEMRESGLDELPLPSFELPARENPSMPEETPVREAAFPPSVISTPPGTSPETDTLEAIQQDLEGCMRCPLHENRRNIVFGRGNPQAPLVLVGEAPGRDEDIKGLPFVGEAGRLLDNILRAMELTREEVYICNVCKCRPPGNRDPEPGEMAVCQPFLKRQLAVIHPRLLVTLGRIAAQTLLNARTPISRLRGVWREYEGIPLMPTYHPAYLLRNPSGKKEVWEDMKQVLRKLRE